MTTAETIRERARTPWRWRSEAIGMVMVGFGGLWLVALLPHLLPGTPLVHLDQARLHAGVGFFACALVLGPLGAVRRALISVVAGLTLVTSVGLFLAEASAPFARDRDADLTLVSFNVLGFNPRGADLAQFFIGEAPDIALVLEAPALHGHLDAMRQVFPHQAGCAPRSRCDMAIFSRHPISDVGVIPFFTIHGRLIQVTVTVQDRPVTLLAAHLTKPYVGHAHARQMDRLTERLARIEGPVILAGDFNSQPFVETFRSHLTDRSDMRLVSRMLPTWPALEPLPLSFAGFAIDHVLVRGDVKPIGVELITDPIGSNHRGLITRFDLDGS